MSPSASPSSSPSSSPSASPSASPTPFWMHIGICIDGEASDDRAGYSVSLSDDGQTVAIGSPGNDDAGNEAGHTRIFKWDGTVWNKLGLNIDGEAGVHQSGYRVSLSGDGNTVAITSPFDGAGNARIFRWDGTTWNKLGSNIAGEVGGDRFGYAVSISDDGNTVAIGSANNNSSTGHTRIYKWDGTNWNKVGLDIDGGAIGDLSGWSVSLSDDGNTVAVGAPANSSNTGRTKIYSWDGTAWNPVGSNIDGEVAGDESGWSVSLSGNGNTVAIGAPYHNGKAGHTRIFEWDGTNWNKIGSNIDGDAADDRLGYSVSLSDDGQTVAVGAPWNNGKTGHSRTFNWDGTNWNQLGSDLDGEAANDQSGTSISLSGVGNTVAIGAPVHDSSKGNVCIFS